MAAEDDQIDSARLRGRGGQRCGNVLVVVLVNRKCADMLCRWFGHSCQIKSGRLAPGGVDHCLVALISRDWVGIMERKHGKLGLKKIPNEDEGSLEVMRWMTLSLCRGVSLSGSSRPVAGVLTLQALTGIRQCKGGLPAVGHCRRHDMVARDECEISGGHGLPLRARDADGRLAGPGKTSTKDSQGLLHGTVIDIALDPPDVGRIDWHVW